MIGLIAPGISAQTIPLTLILDPLPSNVQEGDVITFSGILLTSDQQFFIPDVEICIYEDIDFGTDTLHGCMLTDSQSGEFIAELVTEVGDGGAYDFYAVFEGDLDLESARSQTYSVTVNPIITIQDTLLILDPLPSNVQEGNIITFSGVLLTADQELFIPDAEICFYEDVDFGTDTLHGCMLTDSQSGEFIETLVAEGRNDGWSTSFYAKFDGGDGLESSRSQTVSVKIDPAPKSISRITIDPFDKLADIGSTIIFSGSLEIVNGNPTGKTIIIKDEDSLDFDDVLTTATVNSDGRFQATWIVKDVDSNDMKLVKTLSHLDIVTGVSPLVISFLTSFESNTVEIFAVFEGDETSERTDTCVMKSFTVPNYDGTSMTKQSEEKYCRNNQLAISGLDNDASGLFKSVIISQLVGGMGTNSDLITSFAGDGEINQSETLQLKDMLLGLDPIKEKTAGNSDMSLEEIFNLIENPTSVIEKKVNEKIEEKFDDMVNESPTESENVIPTWIKNNAGWWAEGQIDDNSFVQGIQFMIKENIISIPNLPESSSETTESVPAWVKNNAGWWAEGQIDDNSFVQGIEYLVKVGIIQVN